MSLFLILSILCRLTAMVWSVMLVRRTRDWRMAFLTVMTALMAMRQSLALIKHFEGWELSFQANLTEIPGFAVSIMTFLAVFFLDRMLGDKAEARAQLDAKEQELRQAQKMEAIGRVAGGIAHDFNNRLMAIMNFSYFVKETLSPEDPAHADMVQVMNSAERAQQLVSQILAFSRRQVIKPRVVNLNEVALNTQAMLRRVLGEDIELVFVPDENLRPVKIDPSQFEQILMNLCINARDAMPNGGKLTIGTDNAVHSDGDQEDLAVTGSQVTLRVTDTGSGMDAKTVDQIFEPFFTTKGEGKGTGLGLSTCYGIVKQAGGSIRVDSKVGKGTTFLISLPSASGQVEPLSNKRDDPALPTGDETVLVVEDEPAVREVMVRCLREQGFEVLSASNGSEALQLAKAHHDRIELLVTDLVMPHMTGKEVGERVVQLNGDIKRLYISGYTDGVNVLRDARDSDLPFLQKPFMADALLRKVREVLDE